ncbi:hypothetical protein BCD48_19890 [Pseudofrankia sp. BMG5.36]|nr:hypothetical protein BCD48_19890 [Pseudofrankia sp. BMG5.36]
MRRLTSQLLADPLLAGPSADARVSAVVGAVGRVLAVQAQDLRGLRLAVRSRTTGLTVADVDRAFAERKIVVTWLNRGTLHLVRAEDYQWLHALTAPRQHAFVRRRLAEEGVSPTEADRAVSLVERALADEGPLTRGRLRDLLGAAGVPVAGQALIMILVHASLRGMVVRGPMAGTEQAYALASDWLGELAAPPAPSSPSAPDPGPASDPGPALDPGPGSDPGVDRDAALSELTVRYLAGHGPADDRDLATWSGLPLRDIRRGFALAAEAGRIETSDDGRAITRNHPAGFGADEPDDPDARGTADRAGRGATGGGGGGSPDEMGLETLRSRLLGPFDPVLHGWASRDWVTGPYRGIVTVNGIFRPIALVAGRAAATWTMPAGKVALSPFAPLTPDIESALHAEATDIQRFFVGAADSPADVPDSAG